MKFEVIKDGAVKFVTTNPRCVPSEAIIKDMKKAGYKIRVKEDKRNE